MFDFIYKNIFILDVQYISRVSLILQYKTLIGFRLKDLYYLRNKLVVYFMRL